MKKHKKPAEQTIFKALADPVRREIFHVLMLAGAALSLTQISEQFDMTRQGVTKHIKLLEEAGLVQIKTSGRERFCEPDATPLEKIKDWLSVYDRFWDARLGKLNQYLDTKNKGN